MYNIEWNHYSIIGIDIRTARGRAARSLQLSKSGSEMVERACVTQIEAQDAAYALQRLSQHIISF